MKKYLFLILVASVLGLAGAAFFNSSGHSQLFQANTLAQSCHRTNDTHIVECNYDAGSMCGKLVRMENTHFLYTLPTTVMNDTECLASYSKDEVFWTKTIDSSSVTTEGINIAQTPAINDNIFPDSDCSDNETPYICIDASKKSAVKAYWDKGGEKHFLAQFGTKFYEYVYSGNKWLYFVSKNEFFDSSISGGIYIKFPLTSIPVSWFPTAYADGVPPVVTVEFGKILANGNVEQQFITIKTQVHTILSEQNGVYSVKIALTSTDLSKANVWRVKFADTAGLSNTIVSGWIPAKVAKNSSGDPVIFDANLKIKNEITDTNRDNWYLDFFGGHAQQMYNIVTQKIENPPVVDPNLQVVSAFTKNSAQKVFIRMNNTISNQERVYYILENSGVTPTVPECTGGERIHVSNDINANRSDNLLTGDKGSLTVVGGNTDKATSVTWTISNPTESRLKNASQYANYSSVSVPFDVLAKQIGSTTLATSSVITAKTAGDAKCQMSLTLHFEEGLRVGVEQVDVMLQ